MSFYHDILDTSQLHLEGDFDAQVNQLLSIVRLTRNEVEDLQCVLADICGTLSRVWKGCRVHPFGSIVTGLGIRTSDVDCYVSLPQWVTTPQHKLVFQAKNTLMAEPQIFSELLAIPHAKVPIVKFYHNPLERHCDINFTSPAGVQNSKLLASLLISDPRILPLAVLVKYWSKVHNLSGTNLMPNYGLVLLVVFYLQHLKILPPIHVLQQAATRKYMIDNWNSAFEEIDYASYRSNTKMSLYEMLGGFFHYYSHFDFENQVISTFLGQTIHRNCFKNIEELPKEFGLYRHNILNGISKPIIVDKPMCIQDPFDHSRNCSVCVNPMIYDKVTSFFKITAKIFYKEHPDNFLNVMLKQNYMNREYNTNYRKAPLPRAQPGRIHKLKHKKKNNQAIQNNVRILYSELRKKKQTGKRKFTYR